MSFGPQAHAMSKQVQQAFANSSYDWPVVEVRSAAELEGASGAYAGATRTIYLSDKLVVAAHVDRLVAVLLEELGHDLDVHLNAGNDSAGDEGEIFSALVRGEQLDGAALAELRVERDDAVLQLDRQAVSVEQASFTVTNTNDSGVGSLRQAIIDANETPEADTIAFSESLSGQAITLGSGQLEITESLTIDGDLNNDGAPDITVDANKASRVFAINDSNVDTKKIVTIDGLIITNGQVEDGIGGGILSVENLTVNNSIISSSSANGTDSNGGGIFNNGTLTVSGSTISDNTTTGEGSGIFSQGTLTVTGSTISDNATTGFDGSGGIFSNGTLTINNSTISDNTTEGDNSPGGGIFGSGPITISNSTVSGNTTTGEDSSGGGIISFDTLVVSNSTISGNTTTGDDSNGGGILSVGPLIVSNSTISGNTTTGNNTIGGGVVSFNTFTVSNSIISGNVAQQNFGNEIGFLGEQAFSSSSVLGDNSKTNAVAFLGFIPDTTDITATSDGSNPTALSSIVAPLADSGGGIQTQALPAGSPAIDAGNSANIPADLTDQDNDGNTVESIPFDQRGPNFARIFDGAVDIGAFESQNVAPIITSASAASVEENQTEALTVTATDDQIGVNYSITGGTDAGLFNIDEISGQVSFRAAPDFEIPTDSDGNNIYAIQVTATDADNLTDSQDVTITVTDAQENRAPLVRDDSVVTNENTPLQGNLLVDNGSGADSDPDSDVITLTQVNNLAANLGQQIMLGSGQLTVNADGTFLFDPDGGYEALTVGQSAVETFTYTVSDDQGASNSALVTITIEGIDDIDSSAPTVEGMPATIFVDPETGLFVGTAFQSGQPYEGFLFSNTDGSGQPDDTILGTAGNDNIWAGLEGSDTIAGEAGNDIIGFGAGNAFIEAGSGDDFVYGTNGGGNDSVVNLGEGNNGVWVEQGSYQITSGAGNDVIGLGSGTDTVRAGDGGNIIYRVEPILAGDGRKDILTGIGDDYIQTGSGNDLIDGGAGLNTLLGGAGADTFVLRQGAYNFIGDFEQGVDQLTLDTLSFDALSFFQGTGDVVADAFIFVGSEAIAQVVNISTNDLRNNANFQV